MSFYAYCSKDVKNGDKTIRLRKFTFDRKVYFIIPEKYQDLNDHPLIKTAKNANFSMLINSKTGDYRHVTLSMFGTGNRRSKKSLKYINENDQFAINGEILERENRLDNSWINDDLEVLNRNNNSNRFSSTSNDENLEPVNLNSIRNISNRFSSIPNEEHLELSHRNSYRSNDPTVGRLGISNKSLNLDVDDQTNSSRMNINQFLN